MVPSPIRVERTRSSAMRIFRSIIVALTLGATPVAMPEFAFDGAPANQDAAIPVVAAQPGATAALKNAIPPSVQDTSLTALQYAAEGGHPIAQWKLGRMYADGNGVTQDDLRAFEYFSRIANAHAEDSPSEPQSAIVANAFVALGRYYLNGIPNSKIKSDPERAREMFSYAASYFGNADAQYDLARLYLNGGGTSRDDFRYGARWLRLAGPKGAASGAGAARPDAVQRRPVAAPARPWADVADPGARQRRSGRSLDQGKLQQGDLEGVRRRSRDGTADARALGPGPQGLIGAVVVAAQGGQRRIAPCPPFSIFICARAFSSEVDTGSRQENASKQKTIRLWLYQTRKRSGEWWARFTLPTLRTSPHAVSKSRSAHTGTWSDGFSQART